MKVSENADVVVVGAGAAGLVAAAAAAGDGARVVLLERGDELGGTATVSIGELWVPANDHLLAAGIADPEPECLRLMARLSYPDSYDPTAPDLGLTAFQHSLLVTYYRRSAEAVRHLTGLGALRTKISPAAYGDPLGHPEYHSDLPENLVPQGRHLIVDNGDPAFALHGRDYVSQLSAYLERNGVEVVTGARVLEVERDEAGRVTGLVAEVQGATTRVRASGGVVFCTGGFGHDRGARATYLPGPVDAVAAVETNTGDFLRIGADVGAGFGNMTEAYLGNTAFEVGLAMPRIPALTHFPFGDSMIWVDRHGRRVVNEKGVFTERARVHLRYDAQDRRHSERVLVQVFDAAVMQAPGGVRWPLPAVGEDAPHVLSGATLAELAGRVDDRLAQLAGRTGGIRLADGFAGRLSESVDVFGGYARAGVDPDFGRGATPIQTCYEPRLHEGLPNPTMAPFATQGPYYAMLVSAAMFDTSGGPVIDEQARVLDARGRVIEGLYAAGSCAASPGGQAYWSGGAPMGLALTFGYLAGRAAAAAR
jgi:3-oxosteroid 1-dehydrogenase